MTEDAADATSMPGVIGASVRTAQANSLDLWISVNLSLFKVLRLVVFHQYLQSAPKTVRNVRRPKHQVIARFVASCIGTRHGRGHSLCPGVAGEATGVLTATDHRSEQSVLEVLRSQHWAEGLRCLTCLERYTGKCINKPVCMPLVLLAGRKSNAFLEKFRWNAPPA